MLTILFSKDSIHSEHSPSLQSCVPARPHMLHHRAQQDFSCNYSSQLSGDTAVQELRHSFLCSQFCPHSLSTLTSAKQAWRRKQLDSNAKGWGIRGMGQELMTDHDRGRSGWEEIRRRWQGHAVRTVAEESITTTTHAPPQPGTEPMID